MLQKISLADQAAAALLRGIIGGAFAPGSRLTEEAVSREFGISRTPVREAMRRLAGEGLLESQPGGGFRVAVLDATAVRELFEYRLELELAAMRRALPELPADELLRWKTQLRETGDEEELRVLSLEADEALHSLLAEYCGNRYLARELLAAIRRTAPFRRYRNTDSPAAPLARERSDLFDALIARDPERAAVLLRRHIRNGAEAVRERNLSDFLSPES